MNKSKVFSIIGREVFGEFFGVNDLVTYLCQDLGLYEDWVGSVIARHFIEEMEFGDLNVDFIMGQIIREALKDTPLANADFEIVNQCYPFGVEWNLTLSQKKLLVYCKCKSTEEFIFEWNKGRIECIFGEDVYFKTLLARA